MFLKQTNQMNIWLQLLKEYWITKKYLSHKKTPLPPRTPSFKIKFRSHHYCSLNLFKFTRNCVSSCSPFSSRFYYSNKLLISSLICFEFANMYYWLIQFFHIEKRPFCYATLGCKSWGFLELLYISISVELISVKMLSIELFVNNLYALSNFHAFKV